MVSCNRYYPFLHGPLNFYTPGPKSEVPARPNRPLRKASNWSSAYCCRPAGYHARLCAAPLPRWCSPGPKSTAEPEVRWSSIISFCIRHSRSARKVSTLLFSNLGLQTLFAAPLIREFAAYLVSGRPSVVTAVGICWELFNSSQWFWFVVNEYYIPEQLLKQFHNNRFD